MKKAFIVGILLLAAVSVGAYMFFPPPPDIPTPPDPLFPPDAREAPDFLLKDYNGNTVALADFAGTPLVINSWAAWCPFCRKELSDFAAAQKEFKGEVVIIAIDRQESLETAKRYSDELGVTDDLVFLLDPDDSFFKSIGGFSMPETIFVDADGYIVIHKRGPMDLNEIREKIRILLSNT